ncbi:RNA-directed DNA polymerase, eukaryota, reverse transcriptase zinc-binding domain protein, partial [Tanacetum coccineum]
KSTNKFAVLNDLQGENMKELCMLKNRMIVDQYLNKKFQPPLDVTQNWSKDMIAYFKMKWEEDRAKEGNVQNASMEDVVDSGVEGDKVWSTNEPAKLADASKRAFGGWNWCSNSVHSLSGCRILIGWNSDVVNLMVVTLCMLKTLEWKEDCYVIAKCIVNDAPWLLMRGFNVTLFPAEHSAGGSTVTNDMQEFCDCINDIELEDASSSGLFFTWIKSPLAPTNSVMKKLDGDMINEGFMTAFGNYTTQFMPFVTSDHSVVVMSIPNGVIRKFKAFKFVEFIETLLEQVKLENGNLFEKVRVCRENLKEAQVQMEKFPHDLHKKVVEAKCLAKYMEAFDDEENILFQMAKVDWLSKGDRNNSFFHKIIKSRRNQHTILSVCNEEGQSFEGKDVAA